MFGKKYHAINHLVREYNDLVNNIDRIFLKRVHFEEKMISRLDNRHLTFFCENFFYMNLTENHAILDFIMVGL